MCHVIFDRFIFDSDDFVPHLKGGFPLALHRDGIGRYDDEPPFDEACVERDSITAEHANELEIEDGKLTGRYLGDVVDGKRKAELLRLIAQVEKVDIAQTIAVGDGANDLPMLGIAGLGIAFHAKPKVVANAKQSINTIGLDGVLYFLGFKDSYIDIPR